MRKLSSPSAAVLACALLAGHAGCADNHRSVGQSRHPDETDDSGASAAENPGSQDAEASRPGTENEAGPGKDAGAKAQCHPNEEYRVPGCAYAAIPLEGCYALCEEQDCSRGACLEVSVHTPPIRDDIFSPDAHCDERRRLCIETPLCVAGHGLSWQHMAAAGDSATVHTRIERGADPGGVLSLYDNTGDDPVEVCSMPMPPCPHDDVDLDDIHRAVASPRMREIIETGGLLGSRPAVGSFLRIHAAGQVDIGQPCGGQATCTPIDPEVAVLAGMLQQLTDTLLAKPDCSSAPALP